MHAQCLIPVVSRQVHDFAVSVALVRSRRHEKTQGVNEVGSEEGREHSGEWGVENLRMT